MGLFASQAFPKSLATSLIRYTFDGFWNQVKAPGDLLNRSSYQLWQSVKLSIDILPLLNSIDFTNDKTEAKKLNKLDSQYWLLARLAEGFQEVTKNSDDISWKIKELEERRNIISSRLEPLKRNYLKNLSLFQTFISKLPSFSNKHRKYKQLERVLNELVQNYVLTGDASELQIQELIEILRDEASKLSKTQSLYNVWRLMDWMHAQIRDVKDNQSEVSIIDSQYPPIRALKGRQNYRPKYHVPNGCIVNYPKVEKPEDKERIDFYESVEEAEKADRKICDRCRIKLDK